jgi:hypothetical protein
MARELRDTARGTPVKLDDFHVKEQGYGLLTDAVTNCREIFIYALITLFVSAIL